MYCNFTRHYIGSSGPLDPTYDEDVALLQQ